MAVLGVVGTVLYWYIKHRYVSSIPDTEEHC